MSKRTFRKRMPRRGETGLLMMIRAVGLATLLCAVLTVTTLWTDYDLSAEHVSAVIDHALSQTESLASTELSPGT